MKLLGLVLSVCACFGQSSQPANSKVNQSSEGTCSPNISNVRGSVAVSASGCNNIPPEVIEELIRFVAEFPRVLELLDKYHVELRSVRVDVTELRSQVQNLQSSFNDARKDSRFGMTYAGLYTSPGTSIDNHFIGGSGDYTSLLRGSSDVGLPVVFSESRLPTGSPTTTFTSYTMDFTERGKNLLVGSVAGDSQHLFVGTRSDITNAYYPTGLVSGLTATSSNFTQTPVITGSLANLNSDFPGKFIGADRPNGLGLGTYDITTLYQPTPVTALTTASLNLNPPVAITGSLPGLNSTSPSEVLKADNLNSYGIYNISALYQHGGSVTALTTNNFSPLPTISGGNITDLYQRIESVAGLTTASLGLNPSTAGSIGKLPDVGVEVLDKLVQSGDGLGIRGNTALYHSAEQVVHQ